MEIMKERLLALMQEKGLSTRDLGNGCGISHATIARYIKGERQPKYEQVVAMAKSLGVSPEWLLGIDDKQSMDDDMTVQIVEAMKGLDRKQMVLLLAFIKSMRGTDES